MIKGGFNPYSKSISKRLFKTFTYKSKKRSKSRKAVMSHDGRRVNKLAMRVSKLRAEQFPRRKGKGKKDVKSHKKRQFPRRKTSKK